MKKTLFEIKHLPYLAALFQAVQFAHAGSVYFGPFGWVIGGFGGILTNLAIAGASSRISDISAKRKPLAYGLGILLLLVSPMAIAPAAFLTAAAVAMPWRLMVAIVWAVIPDLSIALTGAIAGKSLISSGDSAQPAQQMGSSGTRRKSRGKATAQQTSRASAMAEQIECKWHCGLSGTKAAMNAHSRFCSKNPAKQFEKAAQRASQ
jgi:hypothetical protein